MAKEIKELKAELKVLEKQYDNAMNAVSNDPAFVKATEMRDKALKAAHKKYKPNAILNKIGDVRDAILRAERDRKQNKKDSIPSHISDLLTKFKKGVDFGGAFNVRWVSQKGRFFVLSISGYTGWSGRGSTSYYPATHYLMDTQRFAVGDTSYTAFRGCKVFECEGKLKKETKQEWIAYAEKEEGA